MNLIIALTLLATAAALQADVWRTIGHAAPDIAKDQSIWDSLPPASRARLVVSCSASLLLVFAWGAWTMWVTLR